MADKPTEKHLFEIRELLVRNEGAEAWQRLEDLDSSALNYPEVLTLRGIALSQIGRSEEATGQFVRATELAPDVAKYQFNLASQYEATDDTNKAIESAQKAIEILPSHPEARALLSRLGVEPPELPEKPPRKTLFSMMVGDQAEQGLPHLLNLGEKWTWFGYGLATLLLIACVLWHVYSPLTLVNAPDPKSPMAVKLKPGPLTPITISLYVGASLLSFIWITLDVIDRRRRFVWLLPMFVCGFCALPILPLALYLKLGRNPA